MRRLAIVIAFALAAALPLHAAITGTLINGDGQAVAGAKLSIFPLELPSAAIARLLSDAPDRTPIASTTSDAKGRFTFPSPKEPVVMLTVSAPGFAPTSRDIQRDDDLGAILLTAAAMKQGRVTANGKPVAGAKVILRGRSDFVATTDAEGRYSVPDPAKWAGRITVTHPDFAVETDSERGPDSRIAADQTLTSGSSLSGHVVGLDGKTAVAGATILIGDVPVAKSGEDGSFTIAHAPKVWQTVEARSGSMAGNFARNGNTPPFIRLAKMATVTGTLRDMKSLAPVAGAVVSTRNGRMAMNPPTDGAITDAKGTFTMAVPPGTYSLNVRRPGYAAASASVNAAAGTTLTKNLVAAQLARVSGTVIDENKSGVSGTRIEAGPVGREPGMRMFRDFSDQENAFAGPDGGFVIYAEPDNDIQIQATKKGLPEARSATMRLGPGERKTGVVLTIPVGIALSGRVVDRNRKPISGAAISASEARGGPGNITRRILRSGAGGEDANEVKTAADGTFTTRVKAGTYTIRVKHDGYATKTLPAKQIASGAAPIEVTLEPGVALSGRVTRGGNAIEGVSVQIFGEDSDNNETKTAADGSFRIENLTPGQAMMNVSKPEEFIQNFRQVTIPADNLSIDLPVGGRIEGHVVEKESKNPVTEFDAGYSGARGGGGMMFFGPGVTRHFTSEDGSFTLEHVPPGATNITVSAAGYTQGRAQNINVEDGKAVTNVEVLLDHGARVSGRVTGPDGSALSGVSVMAMPSGARRFPGGPGALSAVTDGSGEYSIENVETGDKTFTFERSGFLTTQKNATVSGGDARVDAQLTTGLRISGVVVNDTGAPMADASVSASSAADSAFGGRSTRTDANGSFTMDDLAPGHYSFRAGKTGYASGTLNDVDISAGAPVRIVLQSGGTITGAIIGLSADDLTKVTVAAQGNSSNSLGTVDASGNYRIEGAPVGTDRVYASVGGGMSSRMSIPKSVTIEAGGSAQVDLEFAGGTVHGRVTRDGKASSNAMVMFMPSRGMTTAAPVRTTTDGDGNYTAAGLSDATYNVQVVDLSGGTPYQTTFDVHGDGTFNIDIKSATVRGTVTDATTGKPVDDASVQIRAAGEGSMRFPLRAIPTDASGTFIVDSIPPGNYTVSAEKQGYGTKVVDLVVQESGTDVEVKLTPNAGVNLRVVDARDGRAISANVRATDASNKVVYESPFRFTSGSADTMTVPLDAGTYRVTVMAQGYATQTVTVSSPSTQTIGMTPGGSIAIKSNGTAMRRARLIGADGKEYVRGFGFAPLFSVDPSPGTTVIENVAPGTYMLQTLGDGDAVTASTQVTVAEGQVARVAI